MPYLAVHAGGLDYASVLGNIPEEHGQTAIFGIGMLHIADATRSAVGVKRRPLTVLTAHFHRETTGWRTAIDALRLIVHRFLADVIPFKVGTQRGAIHSHQRFVQQAGFGNFLHDAQHATGPIAFLH